MKTNGLVSRRHFRLAVLFLLAWIAPVVPLRAGPVYSVGNVVSNFTLSVRRPWTNLNGQYFPPGSRVNLTDLAGRVLFLEFFDAT